LVLFKINIKVLRARRAIGKEGQEVKWAQAKGKMDETPQALTVRPRRHFRGPLKDASKGHILLGVNSQGGRRREIAGVQREHAHILDGGKGMMFNRWFPRSAWRCHCGAWPKEWHSPREKISWERKEVKKVLLTKPPSSIVNHSRG